jgi:hypothetical protein
MAFVLTEAESGVELVRPVVPCKVGRCKGIAPVGTE